MAIIQISKIQQRSGNLVDLPQLDEAQFGWANDARRLFIGTTTPNPIENVEVLTSYSNISFSQVEGSGGSNVNITTPIQPGQILGYDVDTNSWVNTGGNTEDPGNTSYYTGIPVHLGTIANVKIGGGATGYVLETDGTGNLNWTSKGTLRNTIIDLAPDSGNGNIIVMTVDANTPYTNGLEITISGANATNANAIVNSQNFFIKVANDFPSTGSVELYLTAALDTPNATDGTNLGVYTANSGIATASLSGGSGANAGGSVNTIQFNDGGILNGSANFTITGGNIVSLTGNFSASNVDGGNLVTANFFTGVLTTPAQPNITSTGTLVSLSVSGNANVGNLGVGGVIITTGNSTAGNYITAGIVSATGNGTFGNVTATTFNGALNGAATTAGTVTTNAQPNITSTGILTSLSVSGNADIGNIGTAGLITATGNLNAGNIITAGLMSSTGNLTSGNIITGGLITATGNITGGNLVTGGVVSATGNVSGGNLTTGGALSVTGNANVGNIGAAAGVFTTVAGSLTTASQPNITSLGTLTSLAVTGNISAGNVSATTFTGALSGAATTAGTVTTAAQPNITSVGTLTSLTVGGHIIPSADITYDLGNSTNAFRDLYLSGNTIRLGNGGATITANASAVIITAPGGNAVPVKPGGANTQVQYNDDGIFGGNPGMVFNEGTTTLTVNNFAVTSTADLSTTTLTIKNITTGANTTQGNITGNWVLTAGSKLQATYADLAEYYEADAHYSPGTVLAFGGDKEVTLAEDGTNKVAGVVSTDPAYVMNMKCKGEHIVALALQGRVPTKVRGTIHKGDMLVSGGDGYARNSASPQMGTVIGKALENFDGIEGVIEVAVGRL